VARDDDVVRQLARSSGLTRAEISYFLELKVVNVSPGPIQPALIQRLRRMRRLRRDLGLSLDAVVIIVRLLDRLEAIEGSSASTMTVRVMDERPRRQRRQVQADR
jgi:hypothetical protein